MGLPWVTVEEKGQEGGGDSLASARRAQWASEAGDAHRGQQRGVCKREKRAEAADAGA